MPHPLGPRRPRCADAPARSPILELGLGEEQDIHQETADLPATEFSGTRHGRGVALRIGLVPSMWRERGINEVHVEAPGLAPAPVVWRDLVVEGGPDGILARRPVTAHPQG
jgi:hypothetical protein